MKVSGLTKCYKLGFKRMPTKKLLKAKFLVA